MMQSQISPYHLNPQHFATTLQHPTTNAPHTTPPSTITNPQPNCKPCHPQRDKQRLLPQTSMLLQHPQPPHDAASPPHHTCQLHLPLPQMSIILLLQLKCLRPPS